MDPAIEEIIIQQGTDWYWTRAIAHDDGTLKNLAPGVNEVQTVTITGGPTGGTFTLTYDGQTTAAIAYNATAADVRTALEALSNIGTGDVATSGGPLPATAVMVTFQNGLGGRNVPLMTATSSLTGGTTPAVSVTETTAGVAGWTGAFNVYANAYTETPLISSAVAPNNAVLELGVQGIERASTTLSGAHAAGVSAITVASATGISVGDTITVVQNEIAILEATVTEIAGTTVTMSAPLTDATATGAVVQAWDSRYMLANVLLHIDDAATATLTPFARAKYDIDLTDPFGHETRYWQGPACLQEGTA